MPIGERSLGGVHASTTGFALNDILRGTTLSIDDCFVRGGDCATDSSKTEDFDGSFDGDDCAAIDSKIELFDGVLAGVDCALINTDSFSSGC